MHLVIAAVVTPLTAYLVFWGSVNVIARLDEGWRPAWLGNSSNADVLVFTADSSLEGFTATIVPIFNADGYRAEHPGCTFLIPAGRKSQLQERLRNDLKLSWTTFEIKTLADGQEEITLDFMDRTDDSHGSRYKATNNKVELESYRYVSDRGGIGIILLAMFMSFAIHVLVLGFLLGRAIFIERRKVRSASAVAPLP